MMCGNVNDFSVLVDADPADAWAGIFDPDGKPKQWAKRPAVQPFVEKRRKKQKPQADIGYLTPGALILNHKAYDALADFLLEFGELLELDCIGEVKYYYNVTNLISCIDFANSGKIENCVTKAAFLSHAIPKDSQIFKDPLTANARTYLTSAAKTILEQRIAAAQLTGLEIFEAGTR